MARQLNEHAADLARRWEAARRGHVRFSFGCSCGAPIAHISSDDFERDLIDFLASRHGTSPEGKKLFDQVAGGAPLAGLLSILVSGELSSDVAARVLDDIGRSLASFERPIPRFEISSM